MKLEKTIHPNHSLVINEDNIPVAVVVNRMVAFRLNDLVIVTPDKNGNICPGIKHGGIGRIVEIRRTDTDRFYGVQMENGEFGYMHHSVMKRC